MSLVQLFYVSRAATPYDSEGVKAILATSRRNNHRDDITGCLLFSGCFFAQVLEGGAGVTSGRLDQISADTRHVGFRLLVERPIVFRDYGEWSMGYLHSLDLEDELEDLLTRPSSPPERIVAVMDRMKPDTVMGALSTSF
jgi:hypothetical protein